MQILPRFLQGKWKNENELGFSTSSNKSKNPLETGFFFQLNFFMVLGITGQKVQISAMLKSVDQSQMRSENSIFTNDYAKTSKS